MDESKPKRMHPGAFRSCLVPFTDQILDWWYDELLTIVEIHRRLHEQGLDVDKRTISRFIKVRERRTLARKRPDALKKKRTPTEKPQTPEAETPEKTSPATEPRIPTKTSTAKTQVTEVSEPETEKPTSKEAEEAEEILRHLRETSPQQLWREEYKAKMKK